MGEWRRQEYESVSLFIKRHPQGKTNDWLRILVQDFPKGFPKLACFLDSDDAFMVYRRFGSVFSRLLLRRQDEIRRVEATLQAMDKTDEAESDNANYLMSHEQDDCRESNPKLWEKSRAKVMDDLERKVLIYGTEFSLIINSACCFELKLYQRSFFSKINNLKH